MAHVDKTGRVHGEDVPQFGNGRDVRLVPVDQAENRVLADHNVAAGVVHELRCGFDDRVRNLDRDLVSAGTRLYISRLPCSFLLKGLSSPPSSGAAARAARSPTGCLVTGANSRTLGVR